MVADLARFLDAGKGNFHLRILIGHPFVAEKHIVRGEIIAITEFHALPQIEAPDRGIVRNGPGFCQGRLDLQITVPAHQTLIDVAQKSDGEGYRMGMRVEAVWLPEAERNDTAAVRAGLAAAIRHWRPADEPDTPLEEFAEHII